MTTLEDKAETFDDALYNLASSRPTGPYTLLDDEIVNADELGSDPDSFPEYGDFVEVQFRGGGPEVEMLEPHYLEVTSQLATILVEEGIEPGDDFVIDSVRKGPTGSWQWELRCQRE